MVQDDGAVGLDGLGSSSTMSGRSRTPGWCWSRRSRSGWGSRRSPGGWCGCVATGRGRRTRAEGDGAAVRDGARRGQHRRQRCAARRADAAAAGRLAAGAFDAGDVSARVYVRARPPARQAPRPRRSSVPGRRAPGPATGVWWSTSTGSSARSAAGSSRAPLRLHPAARLSPDPRDARRHARDAAHPPAQGVGEHPEGHRALLRRADRARRARRRERRQAAARRLGVLEHQGLRAPRDRRAGSTRSGCAIQDRPRRGRGDPRGRLAAHRHYPEDGEAQIAETATAAGG